MKRTIKVPQNLYRSGTAETGDNGEIRLSISSDIPYKRYDWFADEEYWEVLDHSPSGVDLSRLKAGAALLFNHKRDVQLGTLREPTLEGGRCYVKAKVSEAEDVKSYRTRIDEGILKDTSVGYELTDEGVAIGAKDGLPVYKFKWAIHEASLVTIPADISVGVGREAEKPAENLMREISVEIQKGLDGNENKPQTQNAPQQPSQKVMSQPATPPPAENPVDAAKERAEAIKDFKARCKKITDFVGALKNEKWKASAAKIAEKHMALDVPDFEDFRSEALNTFDVNSTDIEEGDGQRSNVEVIGERTAPKSAGAQLIDSKEFRDFAKNAQKGKSFVSNLPNANIRATLLTSTGPFTSYERPSEIVMVEQRRLTIRDLLSVGQTTANQIRYTQEDAYTNAATSVAEEGEKPEASWNLSEVTADVSKIAVIGRVSKEAFDDFPYLRSYVDGRLRYMVEAEEEDQLLNGDGTGADLVGLLETPNIQTQSAATDPLEAILRAITKVRETGFYEPDGIVIHPTDYQTFRLMKDANNQYYGGGPFMGQYGNNGVAMQPPIWGLPVVVTSAIAQGTALVGAFKRGAQIWDREGLQIDSTETDGSDWKYNRIAIRLEERLALTVYRPLAFCEVTNIA